MMLFCQLKNLVLRIRTRCAERFFLVMQEPGPVIDKIINRDLHRMGLKFEMLCHMTGEMRFIFVETGKDGGEGGKLRVDSRESIVMRHKLRSHCNDRGTIQSATERCTDGYIASQSSF